jgi:hypothetical protein
VDQQHDWHELKVTPLVLDHLGELVPRGEPTIQVGCFTCNMGWDEGKDVACPGQDLFEEAPSNASSKCKSHGRRYSVGD